MLIYILLIIALKVCIYYSIKFVTIGIPEGKLKSCMKQCVSRKIWKTTMLVCWWVKLIISKLISIIIPILRHSRHLATQIWAENTCVKGFETGQFPTLVQCF